MSSEGIVKKILRFLSLVTEKVMKYGNKREKAGWVVASMCMWIIGDGVFVVVGVLYRGGDEMGFYMLPL